MATGKPPFANIHPLKVISVIPSQPTPKLEGDHWSKEFKNFVAACLIKDPKKVSLSRSAFDVVIYHAALYSVLKSIFFSNTLL